VAERNGTSGERYRSTARFPRDEIYSVTQQMRRAAVSVPSNIAEGKGRGSRRDFRQFLFNARGSLLELQTQIMIAERLGYLSNPNAKQLLEYAAEVGKSLSGLINYLSEDIGNTRERTFLPITNNQ
jgi:four helix bundle protein